LTNQEHLEKALQTNKAFLYKLNNLEKLGNLEKAWFLKEFSIIKKNLM
jgi:hypothetical protein